MNRLYFFTLLLFSSFLLYAQHEQGDVMLEGTSGLNNSLERFDFTNGSELFLKGGYFLSNRFQIGATLATGESLFRNPAAGEVRLLPHLRYYISNREGKALRPFVELGIGTLSEQGFDLSFRPALGLEYEVAPGLFTKVTLQGDQDLNRAQTVALEFSSSISLTQVLADRKKQTALAKGDWLINTDLGHLTYFESDGTFLEGIQGDLNIDTKYFLSDRIALSGSLAYEKRYRYAGGSSDRRFLSTYSTLSLNLGADYNFRKVGIFQPYVGAGLNFSRSLYNYENPQNPDSDYRNVDSSLSPYAKAGTYIHLSDRVLLDLNVGYRFGNSGLDQPRTALGLKMVYRFGN